MHESRRILETVVYESARITQTLFASQDWSLDNSESAHSAVRTVASMNSPTSSSSIGDGEERKRGEERTSMARNVDCPVSVDPKLVRRIETALERKRKKQRSTPEHKVPEACHERERERERVRV